MRQSLFSETLLFASLALQRHTANAVVTGTTVDRHFEQRDFQTILLMVVTGSMVDGDFAVTLEHSSDGVEWDVIPDEPPARGDSVPATLGAAHGSQVYEVAIDMPLRYFRINLAVTNMPDPDPITGELPAGGTLGGFVQLGFPTSPPAR